MAGSASAIRDSIAKSGGRLAGLTDWTGKWTVAAARLPVKVVSGTFKSFPVASGIAAVLGTGMVVGSFFRRGAEKRTERELAAQTAGMQQPMYQISPEDYAALQSRMRDSMAGQGQATGHADRVMAKQAAAAGPTRSRPLTWARCRPPFSRVFA